MTAALPIALLAADAAMLVGAIVTAYRLPVLPTTTAPRSGRVLGNNERAWRLQTDRPTLRTLSLRTGAEHEAAPVHFGKVAR